ncbi:MAG TPA: hypothetical protein VMR46_03320 [Candidatus Paceibacterota bacterium]|nr:hypothetical protein [Candidatus Paceibacterota bacterium]
MDLKQFLNSHYGGFGQHKSIFIAQGAQAPANISVLHHRDISNNVGDIGLGALEVAPGGGIGGSVTI